MDLPTLDYGWAAALTALVILTGAVLNRIWKKEDTRDLSLAEAEAAYRRAVASLDPRRIHVAARRLRRARKAAGG
jgi:hypothetical protein